MSRSTSPAVTSASEHLAKLSLSEGKESPHLGIHYYKDNNGMRSSSRNVSSHCNAAQSMMRKNSANDSSATLIGSMSRASSSTATLSTSVDREPADDKRNKHSTGMRSEPRGNTHVKTIPIKKNKRSQREINTVMDGEDSPDLLATSVGKEVDGRLVPSSSSISLLSLNNGGNGVAGESYNASGTSSHSAHNNNSLDQWRPNRQRVINQHRYPSPMIQHSSTYLPGLVGQGTNLGAPATIGPRRSSFTSPTFPGSAAFAQTSPGKLKRSDSSNNTAAKSIHMSRRGSRRYPQFARPQFSSYQNLQLHGQYQSQGDDVDEDDPGSPSLGPVSASGSPSGFYLTDNSPPSSLRSNSSNFNTYMAQIQQNRPKYGFSSTRNQGFAEIPLPRVGGGLRGYDSRKQSRANSMTSSIGGRSPEFLPTTTAFSSMTPLNLSLTNTLQDNNERASEKLSSSTNNSVSSVISDDNDVFGESIND